MRLKYGFASVAFGFVLVGGAVTIWAGPTFANTGGQGPGGGGSRALYVSNTSGVAPSVAGHNLQIQPRRSQPWRIPTPAVLVPKGCANAGSHDHRGSRGGRQPGQHDRGLPRRLRRASRGPSDQAVDPRRCREPHRQCGQPGQRFPGAGLGHDHRRFHGGLRHG